jgi:hypothetical protein
LLNKWFWLIGLLLPWLGAVHLWLKRRAWNRDILRGAVGWLATSAAVTCLLTISLGFRIFVEGDSEHPGVITLIVMVLISLVTLSAFTKLLRSLINNKIPQRNWPLWALLMIGAVNGLGLSPNLPIVLLCFIILSLSAHQLIFPPELVEDIQTDRIEHLHKNRYE